MYSPSIVTGILFLLTAVDAILTFWIGLFPDHFLKTLHGSVDSDARLLARRTAGFWGAFTLVQGTALMGWTILPVLLLVVAGIRFTECIADWILLRSREITVLGRIGYFFSVPYTLGTGFFLAWFVLNMQGAGLTAPLSSSGEWLFSGVVINVLLVAYFVLNLVRGFVALVLPGRWYLWMHGRVGHDGTGLLARTGGLWLGMVLVEGLVFYFWGTYPFLLAVFAGLRFSEVLADWVYWGSSRQLTTPGQFVLILLPPVHLLTGLYFLSPFLTAGI